MDQVTEKRRVAEYALRYVQDGMKIGIGTGSTATAFIEVLKEKKPDILCVATSKRSEELLGDTFPLLHPSLAVPLDITFDGADRADPQTFHLIKGGGGALLREKLVALASARNVVLVDHTKIVSPLSGFPVALELVPFGFKNTIERIHKAGYQGSVRSALSDNGNIIFDLTWEGAIDNPPHHHTVLKQIPGVIETGFFLDTATELVIAKEDGSVISLVKK